MLKLSIIEQVHEHLSVGHPDLRETMNMYCYRLTLIIMLHVGFQCCLSVRGDPMLLSIHCVIGFSPHHCTISHTTLKPYIIISVSP